MRSSRKETEREMFVAWLKQLTRDLTSNKFEQIRTCLQLYSALRHSEPRFTNHVDVDHAIKNKPKISAAVALPVLRPKLAEV